MSRTAGPTRSAIRASDFGPWIWTGQTSISSISTFIRAPVLTPWSQNRMSLSDSENQNSSSASLSSTGSLRMPPFSLQRMTYLPCIGSMRAASRVMT